MLRWDEFHGWMRFGRLDDSIGLTNAFTIGYRFNDDRTEDWTRRFNAFKEGQEPALYGGLNVMMAAVPQLLDGLSPDFSPRGVERGRALCDKCCAINQLPHDRSAASWRHSVPKGS